MGEAGTTTAANKRTTWKTGALICAVIVIGFALTSFLGYHSSRSAFERNAERASQMAAEGAAREIDEQFSQPVDVSLAMATDTLLADMLDEEAARGDDEAYIAEMSGYLDAYRQAFGFDSVFLVSTRTSRYYHFNGLDRTLEAGDAENEWYFDYLEGDEMCTINIDNDEAGADGGPKDEVTVFVNARILDGAGGTRGIVGVGFRLDDLEELLAGFEKRIDARVRLVAEDGTVRVSTDLDEGGAMLFDQEETARLFQHAASDGADAQDFWHRDDGRTCFVASRRLENLGLFLVVDHDTSRLDSQMAARFATDALVVVAVMAFVLLVTTGVFQHGSRLAIDRALAVEQKHKSVFQEAAEQLYDDIYEVDVTHNRAANESTQQYFESLGVPKDIPFDQALEIIASKQIAADDRPGYLATFSPEAVLAAHRAGTENLSCEFRTTLDGATYHWVRIYAHLFLWDEDGSVRMLVYRQNIDDEKRRERRLFEQMQRDSLTGLYNKAATQAAISKLLRDAPDKLFAFFILDIDDFKGVNDRLGHSAGDEVLAAFSAAVKAQFRPYDIVGRIGGDEFVAFAPFSSAQAAGEKAAELVEALRMEAQTNAGGCRLSSSVGVAVAQGAQADFETLYRRADKALYRAKETGKDRWALYED